MNSFNSAFIAVILSTLAPRLCICAWVDYNTILTLRVELCEKMGIFVMVYTGALVVGDIIER